MRPEFHETPHVPRGLLARLGRHFATHPWRTVFTWVGIVVVLIACGSAFGGKLIDEFKVPGSDFQKAQDLLSARFPARKGASLQIVFAAPAGQRLDTAARKAAVTAVTARAGKTAHVTSVDD